MKKSDFERLPIPHALTFIAEQAGVKWDAEGVEELPKVVAITDGPYGYKLVKKGGELTLDQAFEAVRLLIVIPEIRKHADVAGRILGPQSLTDRLYAIHDLLSGAKP